MLANNPVNILGEALTQTGGQILSFLPNVIIAVILFVLGWVLGIFLGRAVTHVIHVLRIDHALNKAGMSVISERAGVKVSVAGFLGFIVKWTVIVSFTIASTEILNLNNVSKVLSDIVAYIPSVIVASIILIIATLVADFVSRIVESSLRATNIKADFAAKVARWAILIVGGIFPALSQLGIAPQIVEILFTGVIFAISLALGLSFGLGGRDAASKAIERMKN